MRVGLGDENNHTARPGLFKRSEVSYLDKLSIIPNHTVEGRPPTPRQAVRLPRLQKVPPELQGVSGKVLSPHKHCLEWEQCVHQQMNG